MLVAVTIHDGDVRNQNFGLVDNAFVRIVNQDSGEEIARYDLTEDYSAETSLIFGELYKKDGSWRFAAKGDGFCWRFGCISWNLWFSFLSQYLLPVAGVRISAVSVGSSPAPQSALTLGAEMLIKDVLSWLYPFPKAEISPSKKKHQASRMFLIGLGWDERATDGKEFDLDASVFLVKADGKVRGDHDFIFLQPAQITVWFLLSTLATIEQERVKVMTSL